MNQYGQEKGQEEKTEKGQGERKRKVVVAVRRATEREEKGSKHIRKRNS